MIFYPKVTWSGNNQSLTFGTPVDMALAFPFVERRQVRVPSGEQDSWVFAFYPRAKLIFRWIPSSGIASDAGWHFPTPGVYAWLQHQLQDKDDFTLYPDADSGGTHVCRLIGEPVWGRENAQPVMYRLEVEIEDVNGKEFVEY